MHAYYLLFWHIQKHRAEKMIMLILLNRTKKKPDSVSESGLW